MNEPASSKVIEVSALEAFFGKGKRRVQALRGVSFAVKAGECVGFIGANGAGKSTTLKMLMGFRFPDGGDLGASAIYVV